MGDLPFHGRKEDARRAVAELIGQLTGKSPDRGGLARSVFYAIGFQAISDVQEAFIVKARGGTGEDGIKWPPLSKAYLAYGRRFGPGEKAELRRAAGLGRGNNRGIGKNSGLLTAAQQKRWRQVYSQKLAWLASRKPINEAKAIAASIAWNTIKQEGAKTKLEVYGNRQVDILRDTGILFNSISPGYFDGSNYEKPTGEGGDQQVFMPLTDGIVVGTTVKYAAAHNDGKGVPKRQIFPEKVPPAWMERWTKVGMQAVSIFLRRSLEAA